MKTFCKSLKEGDINFEKKKMNPVTNEQKQPHRKGETSVICGKKFEDKYAGNQ